MMPINKPQLGARINWGHPISKNQIACWLFNEGAGPIAHDIIGSAHGTISGTPTWNAGCFGKSYIYAGGSGDTSHTCPLGKSKLGPSFSISLWVCKYVVNPGWIGCFSIANVKNDGAPWIAFNFNSGYGAWYVNSAFLPGSTLVEGNVPFHTALTYDGTTWKWYRDGVLQYSTAGAIGSFDATSTYLGNSYASDIDGYLEAVRIWTRPLTESEIFSLYASPWIGVNLPTRSIIYSLPSTSFIKTYNGLSRGSIKTMNAVDIASVKTINGLA